MEIYFQGILTIFSLVNPVICSQIFGSIERGRSYQHKLKDLTESILTIGFILAISALLGSKLLHLLGISLNAFQVAGGLVLMSIGFRMLNKKTENSTEEKEKNLMPFILFAASPGTITGVITLAISQSEDHFPSVALISILCVLIVSWIIIALLSKGDNTKPSKTSQITTPFMGLIIIAMGIQFILEGILQFSEYFNV
ncbi:hypothetical protein KMW28_25845 [Flammeovirga yaeyamensis]|uniref:UPF0056 membrane protein n=1 Tax=Flammeovirga yaeyamensis TaxID=367791 RepID=A0AAX1N9U8_9BACT|nr:MarC family protein [Flammeovirga yaeyamensis]MBB3699277.1 multiple antibiotic resistance protein [Flammeovirga yaeyamensis]NMF35460.1 MarC family protein [Flammeovirga yaeyamensis]QWG04320.1 hypothetical protein KMW28_25845 [Flammeovirga yaeyamensis]